MKQNNKHSITAIIIFLFFTFIAQIEILYPTIMSYDVRWISAAGMIYIIYILFKKEKEPVKKQEPVRRYEKPFGWMEE